MRPTCLAEGCGFVLWDNPVPVVAALVELEGRIVLARNVAWPENAFGLVTGWLYARHGLEAAMLAHVFAHLVEYPMV